MDATSKIEHREDSLSFTPRKAMTSRKDIEKLIVNKGHKVEVSLGQIDKRFQNLSIGSSKKYMETNLNQTVKHTNFSSIGKLNKFLFNSFAVKPKDGGKNIYKVYDKKLKKKIKEESRKIFSITTRAHENIIQTKKQKIENFGIALSNKVLRRIDKFAEGQRDGINKAAAQKIIRERQLTEKVDAAIGMLNEIHYNDYDSDWERKEKKPLEYFNHNNLKRLSKVRKIFKTITEECKQPQENIDLDIQMIKEQKFENEEMMTSNLMKYNLVPKSIKTRLKNSTINKFKGMNGILF